MLKLGKGEGSVATNPDSGTLRSKERARALNLSNFAAGPGRFYGKEIRTSEQECTLRDAPFHP